MRRRNLLKVKVHDPVQWSCGRRQSSDSKPTDGAFDTRSVHRKQLAVTLHVTNCRASSAQAGSN